MTTNIYSRLIEIGIIFLIVFAPIYYGGVDLVAVTVIEITILFMLLIWGIRMIAQGGFVFIRTPLDIIFLLFCACSLISTLFFSGYTYASYRGLSLVFYISALYFIVVNHIRSRTQLIRLFVVILLVGFIHAFSHLIQNATGVLGASTGMIFSIGNHFAGYMVIIIPLAVAMSFVVRDIGKRVLLMFAGIVMAAAMVFSLVAGAMLAFLFSLILLSLLFAGSESTRKKALILCSIVICLLLVILWFGHTPVLNELLTLANLETGSPAGRLSLWRSSLAMFTDNPITGAGLSTFDYVYPKYRLPDMYGKAVYAHSDWLQLLTELGVIGFMIILSGLVVLIQLVCKRFPLVKLKNDWMKGMVVGGLSSIGAGLVHALVEFNFHIPAIAVLFTIVLGLTVAAFSGYRVNERVTSGSTNRGDTLTKVRRDSQSTKSTVSQWRVYAPVPVRIAGVVCLLLVIMISAILTLRPCIADANYRDGVELERDILWDEAAEKYQSALDISHSNSDYFYALGNVYAKRVSLTREAENQEKWHKLASDAYHKAIELCPTNGDYYLVLGNLHESVGNADGAEAAYMKTISLDPNNAFYHRIYGDFCLGRGEVQKAIAEYRASLEIYPDDLDAILSKLYAKAESQKWFLSMAQRICPQNVRSHITLARFCEGREWYDAAVSEHQQAIAMAPERTDLWKQLSSLLMKQARFDNAASLWQRFLKSHPRNVQAHVQLAIIYIRQNRLSDAIQQYLAAANIDSGDPGHLIKAADLYMQQGKSVEALELWQTAIKQYPHTAAAAYFSLGKYHEEQGDWVDALDSFQRAIAGDPRNTAYRLHLAQSYHRKGLLYEAVQEWEQALELQSENVSIRLRLARIYQQIDRQDKAKEHYCQILKLQPENLEAQKGALGKEG